MTRFPAKGDRRESRDIVYSGQALARSVYRRTRIAVFSSFTTSKHRSLRMVSIQTLKFAPVEDAVPSCTPNLMPFHITYTGRAPMSTFFRPRPAAQISYGQQDLKSHPIETSTQLLTPALSDESQVSLASSSSATLVAASSRASSSLETFVPTPLGDAELQTESQQLLDAVSERRWIAAFRGRTIQGLEVDLPEGYSGVILHAPSADVTQQTASETLRARTQISATIRSTRKSAKEALHHVDDEGDVEPNQDQDGPARYLTPAAIFSSLVVWHPDFPVNANRDEYIRSLNEWTTLASEVSLQTYIEFDADGPLLIDALC